MSDLNIAFKYIDNRHTHRYNLSEVNTEWYMQETFWALFQKAEGALGALNSQAKGPHVDGTLDNYIAIYGPKGQPVLIGESLRF